MGQNSTIMSTFFCVVQPYLAGGWIPVWGTLPKVQQRVWGNKRLHFHDRRTSENGDGMFFRFVGDHVPQIWYDNVHCHIWIEERNNTGCFMGMCHEPFAIYSFACRTCEKRRTCGCNSVVWWYHTMLRQHTVLLLPFWPTESQGASLRSNPVSSIFKSEVTYHGLRSYQKQSTSFCFLFSFGLENFLFVLIMEILSTFCNSCVETAVVPLV